MSTNYELFGITEEVYKEAEVDSVNPGFKPYPSGAYKGTIKEIARFNTASGAGMLKIVFEPAGDPLATNVEVYQNITKKDKSPNEIGTATLKHVLDALGTSIDKVTIAEEDIIAYGKGVKAHVIKGLDKVPMIACVREVYEEGARFPKSNEIEHYAKEDGTNAKGEDIVTKFKEKIAENPVLIRKPKENTSTGSTAAASADRASIAAML